MDTAENQQTIDIFDALFQQNPLPMWFFDLQTLQILDVNEAAIKHYGYDKEEFVGKSIRDLRPEEDQQTLTETLSRLSGVNTQTKTYRHLRKDGSIIYVKIVSYPVNLRGNTARLVIADDVTERELQNERFELISKATHDAIWDWNLDTNKLWWNETYFNLFGYKRDDLEPTIESWIEHIHPEDKESVVNNINFTAHSGKKNWSARYRFLKADGTYAHILDRGYSIYRNGKACRMVGSMMDITALTALQEDNYETESILQSIAQASPTALWMSDPTGKIVYVNEKWIEWSNHTSKTLIQQPWHEIIHPDDRPAVLENYELAHRDQIPYDADYRILYADGSVRWITAKGLPRLGASGEFLGFVGSSTDITKQKNLELQKDVFINTVSHELRTPIASIKAYGQLLSRSGAIQDPQPKTFLDRMGKQISRLNTLVQDLLDVSRMELGSLMIYQSTFDANLLLAELVSELQLAYPSHKLVLLENQNATVHADQERTSQLITNLVDNAVKYSPEADRVYISLVAEDSFVEVKVQDFGVGITKAQQPYVFDKFYQVNNVKKVPGLGIGLYICKEIVKLHGGDLWFETNPDAGTIFHFKLPVNR
jgi:PAS domain S-box-containing protein